jgi:hypothetical protein
VCVGRGGWGGDGLVIGYVCVCKTGMSLKDTQLYIGRHNQPASTDNKGSGGSGGCGGKSEARARIPW